MKITMDEQGNIDPRGALAFVIGDVSIAEEGEPFPQPSPAPKEGTYTCTFCDARFDWKRGQRIDHNCTKADE